MHTAALIKYLIKEGFIDRESFKKRLPANLLSKHLRNDNRTSAGEVIAGAKFLCDAGLLDIKTVKSRISFGLLKDNLNSGDSYVIKNTVIALKALSDAGLIDSAAWKKYIPFDQIVTDLKSHNSLTLINTIIIIEYLIDMRLLDSEFSTQKLLPQLLLNLRKDDLSILEYSSEIIKSLIDAELIEKNAVKRHIPLKRLTNNLHSDIAHVLKSTAVILHSFISAGLIDSDAIRPGVTLASVKKSFEEGFSPLLIYAVKIIKPLADAGVLDRKEAGEDLAENLIRNLQKNDPDLTASTVSAIKSLVEAGIFDKRMLLCGIDFQKTVRPVPEKFRYYYLRLIEKLYKNTDEAYSAFDYLNPVLLNISETVSDTEEEDSFYDMLAKKIKKGIPANEIALEYIKERVGLSEISLKDGGDSPNSSSLLAEIVLSEQKGVSALTSPENFPELKSLHHNEIPACPSFKDIIPKGYKLAGAQGRTLLYKNPQGKCLALKALKLNEDASFLDYESRMFAYLNANKEQLGLNSAFPKPHPIHGNYVIKIKPNAAAKTALYRQVNKDGHRYELNIKDGYYTFMAYETADDRYFTYLREADIPSDKFQEALFTSLRDLFTLARHGIIHTAVIELFHNLVMKDRHDGGKYLWMVDIIRPMQGRCGAGRLHAWTKTVEYPNMRLSGLADFPDLFLLKDLVKEDNPFSEHMQTFKGRHPEYDSEVFYLASYLGDYLLSATLVAGRYLRDRGELDWKNPGRLAGIMKNCYINAFTAFTDRPEREIRSMAKMINWDRFAMQMSLNMAKGDEMAHYLLENNVPEQIYGPGVSIDYANDYSASRGWVDTPEKRGWYFDNKNPDLGPVNGSNPLQELIKANFIFTAFCLTNKSKYLASSESASMRQTIANDIRKSITDSPETTGRLSLKENFVFPAAFKGTEKARHKRIARVIKTLFKELVSIVNKKKSIWYNVPAQLDMVIDLSNNPVTLDSKEEIKELKIYGRKEWPTFYVASKDSYVTITMNGNPKAYACYQELFGLLKGSELEQSNDAGAGLPVKPDSEWDDWTRKDGLMPPDGYGAYERIIDKYVLQYALTAIKETSSLSSKKTINVFDLFAGTGRLIRRIDESIKQAPGKYTREEKDVRYFLAERNNKLVEIAKDTLSHTTANIHRLDLLNCENLNKEMGAKADMVILEGAITRQVIAGKDEALDVIGQVNNVLYPGGFCIVAGYTGIWLNAADFRSAGFEVLNMSIPKNTLNHLKISQFYILRKPLMPCIAEKIAPEQTGILQNKISSAA